MHDEHISIVTPVYGCGGALNQLYDRLKATLTKITENYEIIMVNDGSPDDAWDAIKRLAKRDDKVKGINLSRNFGQHYAIIAGLNYAKGEWVVVMDCDLQDQPEEISKLYDQAQKGYDMVFGRRANRQDAFFKKFISKMFYKVLGYLTDTIQDESIANFGIFNKNTIEAVNSMGDQIKYFPVMIRWVGFSSCAIDVEHADRKEGESAYSLTALLSLAVDIMLSFSDKPLKIAVKAGFFMSTISFFVSLYVLIKALLDDVTVPGWASTIMSLWFLSGLIIMVLGIVGIYIGKTFDQTKNRPLYIVKEVI